MTRRQYAGALVALFLGALVGGAMSPLLLGGPAEAQRPTAPAKVVRANRFEVVGKQGRTLARLGEQAPGEARLVFPATTKGRCGAEFGVSKGKVVLAMSAGAQGSSVILGASEVSAYLSMYERRPRVFVGFTDGKTGIDLVDAKGVKVWSVGEGHP